MSDDRERKVRDRAYALWESEGRPAGRHDEHWYRAGNEVDTDSPAAAEATPAKKPRATKAVKAAIPTSDKPYPKDEGADDLETATTKAKRAAPRKAAAVRAAPAAKAEASAAKAAAPAAAKPAAPRRAMKAVKPKPA